MNGYDPPIRRRRLYDPRTARATQLRPHRAGQCTRRALHESRKQALVGSDGNSAHGETASRTMDSAAWKFMNLKQRPVAPRLLRNSDVRGAWAMTVQMREAGGNPNHFQAGFEQAADLHWLAYLLTGRRDLSIEIAVDAVVSQNEATPYFASWMSGWSRRVVLSKALAAIRDEVAESARRTKLATLNRWDAVAPSGWSLNPGARKAEIEEALLGIDMFPRVAVLL